MKKFVAMIVIGLIFVIIGFLWAIGAANLSPTYNRFEIPSGSAYYNYIETYIPSEGELIVNYKVNGGTSIDLYVFTPAQYHGYQYYEKTDNMASGHGSSGTVNFKPSYGGSYYIVLDHGSGFFSAQSGTVDYKINGVDLPSIIVAGAIIVIGIILVVYGGIMMKKETVVQPEWVQRQSTGVLYFKDDRPPIRPPQT